MISSRRGRYAVRRSLAQLSGNPGNSCIHLTDKQDEGVLAAYRSGARRRLAGGMACDDSYAYACARALLHPASVAWLNSDAAGLALGSSAFRRAWGRYTAWLHEPPDSSEDEAFSAAPDFCDGT